jgi:hypothetical protein
MDKQRVSLRRSIDEKCKSCIYDPLSRLGTWREQVAGCTVTRCALYQVRPLPRTAPLVKRPQPAALAAARHQREQSRA